MSCGVTGVSTLPSLPLYPMKTRRISLLLICLSVVIAPALQAQVRMTPADVFRRAFARTPVNGSTSVTRATPQGDITVTSQNSFNGTSGTYGATLVMPNSRTASVSGTVSITNNHVATVSGTVTGPAGNTTSFTNTVTPAAGNITITTSMTPPSGNTVTHTTTITPPTPPVTDTVVPSDNTIEDMLTRLLRRLGLPLPPRG